MELLRIVQLLTYSFGAYAFGSALVMTLRPASPRPDDCLARGPSRFARTADLLMLVVCLVWFCTLLAHTLDELRPGRWLSIDLTRLVLMYQFPPLIALVNYADARKQTEALAHAAWRTTLVGLWVLAEATLAYALLAVYDVLPAVRPLDVYLGLSISALFVLASVFSSFVVVRGRPHRETQTERSGRRWMLGLYLLMVALVGLIVTAYSLGWPIAEVFAFVGTSLPLIFMFTATYHADRFEFFDLFVKRGLLVLATIVLLTAFFGGVLPRLEAIELGWARPWVYAVALSPAVLALPWVYRKMGAWLDNVWLGRRLTTLEAMKRFLSDLGQGADRRDLVLRAERGLSEIFNAPAQVRLSPERAQPDDAEWLQQAPVVSPDGTVGVIRLGRRANHVPYFSEDRALLGSLADVFSHMLRAVDLHRKKREQEQLARELSLRASRAELRALRAQINPHFLFNALNTIAALIHQDPARADQTVEQLAEIFRYTLRGSDSEWTPLDDEIDFVRSYLEVERARFGERLSVEITADAEARAHFVPTMMIQTLVENAVKHGVARVRGVARIEVDATVAGDRLVVAVRDSGPGFDRATPASVKRGAGGGGYGLHNVRRRLLGHFGAQAALEVRRDETRGRTEVRLVFPSAMLERVPRPDAGRSGPETQGAAR
ncbi:MAG TPA: histidine kinase [Candidatus Polarisedimenticolaceae bacterium]|nr:histidine kinase [Candidatus Polarisedimenticolaceae bacterium]